MLLHSTDMYERHQTSYQTDSWSPWVKLNDIEPVRQLVAQKANLADFSYQKIGNFEVRKYPDGTMIQTNAVSFRGKHLSGQVYSFNWAVSFVSAPMVFGSVKSAQGYNIVDRFQTDMKTESNGSTYHYYLYDPDARTGDWDMQFLAIGRWK